MKTTKRTKWYLWLLFLLPSVIFSCADEMEFVDPMVFGLAENIEEASVDIAAGSFGGALIGLRAQRIQLIGIRTFIEKDGYSGDNYELEDKEAALQRVAEAMANIEFKLDSVWDANIGTQFNNVNPNSAGIQNFGFNAYEQTSTRVADAELWLMADADDDTVVPWVAIDFVVLQESIAVLIGLSNLNEQEVIDFVNQLEAQYATMLLQYADLEAHVNTSPYFTQAQKELYANLAGPMEEIGVTIEQNLSLDTKVELDLIDRDLYGLVYFVENNYTSPPQFPKVYGEISSITELRWFSEVATIDDYNNSWVLTTDIDASETHRWNLDKEEKGFQTIKPETSIKFDGQYHIIHGLFMTKVGAPDAVRPGFFMFVNGGSIDNFGLVNVYYDVPEGAATGSQGAVLAGRVTNTTVANCFTHGVVSQALSQAGGFIGRPQTGVIIRNCFAAVDMGPSFNAFSSSFLGLPVGTLTLENCYNIGKTDQKAIFGHGSGCALTASNIYYDSQSVGSTVLDRGDAMYTADSPKKLGDAGVVTDVPTSQWNNLANFPGFSPDIWEIRTVPQIDPNPRPYLKGFNYDAIQDFLVPGQ